MIGSAGIEPLAGARGSAGIEPPSAGARRSVGIEPPTGARHKFSIIECSFGGQGKDSSDCYFFLIFNFFICLISSYILMHHNSRFQVQITKWKLEFLSHNIFTQFPLGCVRRKTIG